MGQVLEGEKAGVGLGRSVAVAAGSRQLILAMGANFSAEAPGHVRLYRWNDSSQLWEIEDQDIHGEAIGDGFGISVSMSASGQRVVVGSHLGGYVLVFQQ
mgnify:CR=1 FL=1